jgi:ATP-binding cassette subfamily B protein
MKSLSAVRASFAHIPKSLGLATRASPAGLATIFALTLVAAVLPLAVAYVGKLIVDAVVAQDVAAATRNVALELGLVAGQAFVQRTLGLLRSLLGARLGLDVNVMILRKALGLSLENFEDAEFYDKLTRARREASSRPVLMVTDTLQLGQNVLTLAGYVTLLVTFSGWAVLGLVLAAIPATIAEMRFSNAAFRLRNWRSPDTRRLNYVEYVLANDAHAKEVKVFGLGRLLLDRYVTFGERFYGEDKRVAVQRTTWGFGLSLLATAAFYACYWILAGRAAGGLMTLGNLTLYIVAFRQGQQAFQSSLAAIGSMYEHNLYMSNLFEFLGLKETETPAPAPGADAAGTTVHAPPSLRLENVGFRYQGSEAWALRHVDLEIPAGQSLALVGHNGAGKSTLIKLLCRLYEPTEGRILLDGKDLRSFDETELRRRIGVVFQDFNRYQFTARENIGFGSVDHLQDEPRLQRAIDAGGAREVVQALPDGLETPLGKWFMKGSELSGGQWQKIALARSFAREEADLLILDEPTAALDAEAEHQVFERFRAMTKGRTAILISHRFPTVRMADRIVVLDPGTIVESGTHDQLLAAGARDALLCPLQAKGYL